MIPLSRFWSTSFNEALGAEPDVVDRRPLSYNTEWERGLWDQKQIDGVELWYPQAGNGRVGAIRISAGPHVESEVVRVRSDDFATETYVTINAATMIVDSWTRNANRMFEWLEWPIRISADCDAVEGACGEITNIHSGLMTDRYFLKFRISTLDEFEGTVLMHDSLGLLGAELRDPLLFALNITEL
ncbi:MAG: hypothetical protein WEB58_13700 [Planctomycetaceae bacterium]|jgi:hypothetical protein